MKVGDRVKIAAWTDLFMRGETHGTVTKITRRTIHIEGHRSGMIFRFTRDTEALEVI